MIHMPGRTAQPDYRLLPVRHSSTFSTKAGKKPAPAKLIPPGLPKESL
jgi:hypothetical protein